jgi:hypothetical protein
LLFLALIVVGYAKILHNSSFIIICSCCSLSLSLSLFVHFVSGLNQLSYHPSVIPSVFSVVINIIFVTRIITSAGGPSSNANWLTSGSVLGAIKPVSFFRHLASDDYDGDDLRDAASARRVHRGTAVVNAAAAAAAN